jgi:hypothetical protein
MKNKMQLVSMLVLALGIISLVIGAVFVGLAIQKNNYVVSTLKAQKVTLGLTQDQINQGQVVDNSGEALAAANILAEHLQKIAPTYNDLMSANTGGKFDPTSATNLDYAQGLNMENSFNMVVLSFGVIQETIATGIALIVIGIGVGATGLVLFKLSRKSSEVAKA